MGGARDQVADSTMLRTSPAQVDEVYVVADAGGVVVGGVLTK